MRKMISYIHHLKGIFEELGILYNTKNKKDMHVLMQQFTQESEDKKIWEYIKPYVTKRGSDKELIEFIKRNWGAESKLNLDEQMKPDINRASNAQ